MGAHLKGPEGKAARARLHAGYRPRIEWLLREAELHVIESTADDRLVVGWICIEPGIVHYVLTRRRLQRYGVAGKLVRAILGDPIPTSIVYSHLPANKELVPEGWTYDPNAGAIARFSVGAR